MNIPRSKNPKGRVKQLVEPTDRRRQKGVEQLITDRDGGYVPVFNIREMPVNI